MGVLTPDGSEQVMPSMPASAEIDRIGQKPTPPPRSSTDLNYERCRNRR